MPNFCRAQAQQAAEQRRANNQLLRPSERTANSEATIGAAFLGAGERDAINRRGPRKHRHSTNGKRFFASSLDPRTGLRDGIVRLQPFGDGAHRSVKRASSKTWRTAWATDPRCGGRMMVIEVFARGCQPTYRPTYAPTPIGIDTP